MLRAATAAIAFAMLASCASVPAYRVCSHDERLCIEQFPEFREMRLYTKHDEESAPLFGRKLRLGNGVWFEHAVFADSGKYFVIVGGNGFSIFSRDGTLLRSRVLEEFVRPQDLDRYSIATDGGGRQWFGGAHIEGDTLVLQIVPPIGSKAGEVRFELATGTRLGPPPNLALLAGHVTFEDPQTPIAAVRLTTAGVPVSADELLRVAVDCPLPRYPPIAFRARISGVVIADVAVGEDGRVRNVHLVKPLPFGLDAAVQEALQQWTFATSTAPFASRVEFRFSIE